MRAVLDRIYIAAMGARTYLSELRRWSREPVKGAPMVYYGFENIPRQDAVVSGGLVKCQDLDGTYPNCTAGANLMYLVSSCYPLAVEYTVGMAKRKGIKFVLNQNGVAYHAWFGDGWENANVKLRTMLHEADYVIYQSEFCKNMSDEFLGTCKSGWEILYNPVDTSFFLPAERTSQSGRLNLLLAGSHGQLYRIESALRTLSCLLANGTDARLVIAGRFYWHRNESRCVEEMRELCRSLGVLDKVEWAGGYSQLEAVSLFQKTDILLHPTYNDVCPRLVVESMSCGVPVVYSCSGGTSELVGSDAGIGVSVPRDWNKVHVPGDEAMADAVRRIAADLGAYSSAARSRAVSKFDVKPWIERHGDIFRKLL